MTFQMISHEKSYTLKMYDRGDFQENKDASSQLFSVKNTHKR